MKLTTWNWITLLSPYLSAVLVLHLLGKIGMHPSFLGVLIFCYLFVVFLYFAPYMEQDVKTGRSFKTKYGRVEEYETKLAGGTIDSGKIAGRIILTHFLSMIICVFIFFKTTDSNSQTFTNNNETKDSTSEESPSVISTDTISDNYEMGITPTAQQIEDTTTENPNAQIGSNTKNIIANRKAEYESGQDTFIKYIMNQIKVPENVKSQKVEVLALLKIDSEGNVTLKSSKFRLHDCLNDCDEIIKWNNTLENDLNNVIFKSPKWKPSVFNGENIDSEVELYLYFGKWQFYF